MFYYSMLGGNFRLSIRTSNASGIGIPPASAAATIITTPTFGPTLTVENAVWTTGDYSMLNKYVTLFPTTVLHMFTRMFYFMSFTLQVLVSWDDLSCHSIEVYGDSKLHLNSFFLFI